MSDSTDIPMTDEEKIVHAKDLYARGSRNYLVKDYTEAADELSEVCALYAEIYGDNSDELGMPYLLYAKSLVALAQQGEHKIMEIPEEEPEDDDDNDDNDEGEGDETEAPAEASVAGSSGTSKTNGSNGIANGESVEPKPGTSGEEAPTSTDDPDVPTEEEEDTQTANLQIAWEVLELAVQIFLRQGDSAASNLAAAYFELAEISFENAQYEAALRDYKNSLEIRMKLPEDNLRLICEIEYRIGLIHMMLSSFDFSIAAFNRACEILDAEIDSQKCKNENADRTAAVVKELEELKVDILNKIVEVEEAKAQSIEEVKSALAKRAGHQACGDGSGSSAAGASGSGSKSSSTSAKSPLSASAKPMDISHLIKRKKPDTPADETVEQSSSPAKRPAA